MLVASTMGQEPAMTDNAELIGKLRLYSIAICTEAADAQAQEAALEQLEHARRDARIFALEEAAQTCEKQQNVSLSGGVCRTLDERFVCGVCAAAIRALKREP